MTVPAVFLYISEAQALHPVAEVDVYAMAVPP
jgi:hypothetical protein